MADFWIISAKYNTICTLIIQLPKYPVLYEINVKNLAV